MIRPVLTLLLALGAAPLLLRPARAQEQPPAFEPASPSRELAPTSPPLASLQTLRGTAGPVPLPPERPRAAIERSVTGSTGEAASATPAPGIERLSPPQRSALPPMGENDPMVYVVEQDLRTFLVDFARRMGLRSEIAPSVRGRLTKVKLPAEPMALLSELEKRHEIEWILEGEMLKVTSRNELATRILPLTKVAYDELLREMSAVGIDNIRYPLQNIASSNAVIVTAPVQHVARIAALIETLKAGKAVAPDLKVIRAGVPQKVTFD